MINEEGDKSMGCPRHPEAPLREVDGVFQCSMCGRHSDFNPSTSGAKKIDIAKVLERSATIEKFVDVLANWEGDMETVKSLAKKLQETR